MKREELEALGLTKEQVDKVCDLNNADVSPLKSELQAANEKVGIHENTIRQLKENLDEFKDVDVSELKQKIINLEGEIEQKDIDYQRQIADRDFSDLLKNSIASVHGKNEKAIAALLDIEALKASKNQKEDVTAAIKALTEAEDSKFLFGEVEPKTLGTGNPIGNVGGNHLTAEQKEDADCRAAMGLPPLGETKGDK